MLPSIGRFTTVAPSMLGNSVAVGQADSRGGGGGSTLVEPPGYQVPGPLNVPGDPEPLAQPGVVARGPTGQPRTPRDVAEIPLESKVLINPMETLSALYVSRMLLHGHRYRIGDDRIRWAHFQHYLQLLPQHTPPTRTNFVKPRHLWEVWLGKARRPDDRQQRPTLASTCPGTVTSQRRTRIPCAQSCAAP